MLQVIQKPFAWICYIDNATVVWCDGGEIVGVSALQPVVLGSISMSIHTEDVINFIVGSCNLQENRFIF